MVGSCNVQSCKMGMEGGTRHEREAAVTVLPHMMLEYISTRDHRVMRRLNSWRAPLWVRLWMICATRGGDGWLWYAMSFAIFLYGGPERYAALLTAGIAAFIGTLLFLVMKRHAKRRRPCAIAEHCWATLLPPDQFSFPSGHSITAFAFADFVQSLLPQSSSGIDVRRLQRCDFAHRSRHAFPQ